MGRRAMRDLVGGGALDLDEDEAVGGVGLLEDIEAGDAGLEDAGAGVGERGGFERFGALGFDVDEGVDDGHDGGYQAAVVRGGIGTSRVAAMARRSSASATRMRPSAPAM